MLTRSHAALVGLSTMACFPMWTLAEVAVDDRSHNLFPIEIVMYGIYSIPAIVAAMVGRRVLPRPRPQTA